VFLFGALTLWGVLELARLRGPGQALADDLVQRMVQQAISGRVKHLTGTWAELIPSAMRVRPALAGVVVLGVAGTCFAFFDPFVRPLVTIEGVHFGRFVSSTILLLQVMIASRCCSSSISGRCSTALERLAITADRRRT
jgi:hypothetical protein